MLGAVGADKMLAEELWIYSVTSADGVDPVWRRVPAKKQQLPSVPGRRRMFEELLRPIRSFESYQRARVISSVCKVSQNSKVVVSLLEMSRGICYIALTECGRCQESSKSALVYAGIEIVVSSARRMS